ncbi:hypothetical protein FIBSPDRAFT_904291 [Athelia psychrophila]|uniref:Uncharacterized protein n=1 Tax=Athelia psychrophila TaxID=1759441 RepID=A0A167UXH2_9AGAM|nr:hypothetical protein FIBSPDRAFT_904291 [Fibularhizoctonia sp. CBS 109695]
MILSFFNCATRSFAGKLKKFMLSAAWQYFSSKLVPFFGHRHFSGQPPKGRGETGVEDAYSINGAMETRVDATAWITKIEPQNSFRVRPRSVSRSSENLEVLCGNCATVLNPKLVTGTCVQGRIALAQSLFKGVDLFG